MGRRCVHPRLTLPRASIHHYVTTPRLVWLGPGSPQFALFTSDSSQVYSSHRTYALGCTELKGVLRNSRLFTLHRPPRCTSKPHTLFTLYSQLVDYYRVASSLLSSLPLLIFPKPKEEHWILHTPSNRSNAWSLLDVKVPPGCQDDNVSPITQPEIMTAITRCTRSIAVFSPCN